MCVSCLGGYVYTCDYIGISLFIASDSVNCLQGQTVGLLFFPWSQCLCFDALWDLFNAAAFATFFFLHLVSRDRPQQEIVVPDTEASTILCLQRKGTHFSVSPVHQI